MICKDEIVEKSEEKDKSLQINKRVSWINLTEKELESLSDVTACMYGNQVC